MTTPAAPLPPEQNIGPYYRNVGIFLMFLLGADVLTLLAAVLLQVPLTDTVFKVLGVMAAALLVAIFVVIWRPGKFDDAFRTIIAALPWTKYQGSTPAGAP